MNRLSSRIIVFNSWNTDLLVKLYWDDRNPMEFPQSSWALNTAILLDQKSVTTQKTMHHTSYKNPSKVPSVNDDTHTDGCCNSADDSRYDGDDDIQVGIKCGLLFRCIWDHFWENSLCNNFIFMEGNQLINSTACYNYITLTI